MFKPQAAVVDNLHRQGHFWPALKARPQDFMLLDDFFQSGCKILGLQRAFNADDSLCFVNRAVVTLQLPKSPLLWRKPKTFDFCLNIIHAILSLSFSNAGILITVNWLLTFQRKSKMALNGMPISRRATHCQPASANNSIHSATEGIYCPITA